MPYELLSKNNISVKNILMLPLSVSVALVLVDLFSFILAKYVGLGAYNLVHDTFPQIVFENPAYKPHQNLHLILGFIVAVVMWTRGLYTNRMPWWSQVRILTKIAFFALIVHGFLSVSLKVYESRLFMLLYWAASYAFIILGRAMVFIWARRLKGWLVPTVIVSDPTTIEDLLFAFASDISTGYKATTLFIRNTPDELSLDLSGTSVSLANIDVRQGTDELEPFIRARNDVFYVISLDTFHETEREQILGTFADAQSLYAVVPSLSRANLYQMEPKYFFGHDVVMLHIRSSAPDVLSFSLSMAIKRLMDITASGLALLIAGPVILTLGAMLKIEGQGGSIFYGGKRIGRGGAKFHCWKLRSMEPDSDHLLEAYLDSDPEIRKNWEIFRKLPKDPRITTHTARLIRKLSLDELPQLWNIFVGDMSLVGPRPILEDEIGYFTEATLKDYLSVRPGLTGLWQVSGRNKTSFKRRVYWDSWYVRNWSLWGDIIILIKTPLVLLSRKGAS